MPRLLISLTTDFGLQDHYVGVMKGVIAGIAPECRVVDLTHGIPAHSIEDGAFSLYVSYRYFPPGSIHVVVVDPGVGSARGAVGVSVDRHYFIAPDNGLLSYVVEEQDWHARELDPARVGLTTLSQTFHGRDLFAPAGARLAAGLAFEDLGPPLEQLVRLPPMRPAREDGRLVGRVLHIDVFGNVVTSFAAADLRPGAAVSAGGRRIDLVVRSYADIPSGELALIAGSSGCVEISLRQASAADVLAVKTGDSLSMTL